LLVQEAQRCMAQTINLVRTHECSARVEDSAREIFDLACDMSMHPIMPLYHHIEKRMRCRAIRAFSRIFNLCCSGDQDTLSLDDLKRFHLFAYQEPVTEESLRSTLQVRSPISSARFFCFY
jgi:hypothetical protein